MAALNTAVATKADGTAFTATKGIVDNATTGVAALNNALGNKANTVAPSFTGEVNMADNLLVSKKLGVGTISPESALRVVGTKIGTPLTAGIHMGGPGDYAIEICSEAAANSAYIDFTYRGSDYRARMLYNNSTNALHFYTNAVGTPKLTMLSSGNVGINTAAPTSALHVVGSGNITENTIIGGTLASTGLITATGGISSAGAITKTAAGAAGIIRAGGGLSSSSLRPSTSGLNDSITFFDYALNPVAVIDGNGFSSPRKISTQENVIASGSVGIGTTTPTSALQVCGPVNIAPSVVGVHMGTTPDADPVSSVMSLGANKDYRGSCNINFVSLPVSGENTNGGISYLPFNGQMIFKCFGSEKNETERWQSWHWSFLPLG